MCSVLLRVSLEFQLKLMKVIFSSKLLESDLKSNDESFLKHLD